MGEIKSLIQEIQIDKNAFKKLVDKMEPLINKYVKLLYKDDKEDIHSEMVLALWEAVIKMEYCEKERECVSFLCTALKNRFYELYRKSRKEHDNQVFVENNDIFDVSGIEDIEDLESVIFNIDVELFLNKYAVTKQKIIKMIILEDISDAQIAKLFSVSRQYVNRLRRKVYKEVLNGGLL